MLIDDMMRVIPFERVEIRQAFRTYQDTMPDGRVTRGCSSSFSMPKRHLEAVKALLKERLTGLPQNVAGMIKLEEQPADNRSSIPAPLRNDYLFLTLTAKQYPAQMHVEVVPILRALGEAITSIVNENENRLPYTWIMLGEYGLRHPDFFRQARPAYVPDWPTRVEGYDASHGAEMIRYGIEHPELLGVKRIGGE